MVFNKQKLYVVILTVLLFFQSCQVSEHKEVRFRGLTCHVDTLYLDKNLNKFIIPHGPSHYDTVNIGGYLNNQEAHSGDHSILLTGKKQYGLSAKYSDLQGDEHFVISVWRKDASGKAGLIVEGDKKGALYIAQKVSFEKDDNDWEKLEIDIEIPPNITKIKIYAWKIDADSAFFDDLVIKQLPTKQYPSYVKEQKLHLYFTDKKIKKFRSKRFQAFEDGILISDGEWMKGVMSDEKEVMPIKARLKGDWLDHLHGKKWSLRIKMRDDYTFNRMKVFSLQNPLTRFYLNEYMAHQLYAQEDVLTTRYGFIPVYFNGNSLGIYAWEEHFAKQLIEYNLRREGPILKFDEDPFWRMKQEQEYKLSKDWMQLPYYESSRVIAFGMSKLLSKPALKQQFYIAQGLMYQYKNQKAPVEELFNLDVLAKYWAIGDIINGIHGRAWHNQRMYYNPVLCKLEPINFDDFTEQYPKGPPATIAALSVRSEGAIPVENNLLNHIFSSSKFLSLYLKYLEKYSDEELLKAFIEGKRQVFEKTEKLLQEEFKHYKFDSDFLLKNAALIRKHLPAFKEKLVSGYYQHLEVEPQIKVTDTAFRPILFSNYINAYYFENEKGKADMLLENYNGRTIEVLGLTDDYKQMIYLFKKTIFLSPFVHQVKDTSISLVYKKKASFLAFKVNNHDSIFYSELSLWEKNTNLSPYQILLHSSDYSKLGLFEEVGDSLIIRAGNYQLNEKVMIPENKVLVFDPGVNLDIVNQSTIISYATVIMRGTKNAPIKIFSSDSTANAFTVIQAKGRSMLNYVVFSHLNTMSYDGWNLSGSVNFYESDVKISNCTFEYNHCEDALNIVRSEFLVTQSKFHHIFADAFDSDFCTGLLEKSSFQFVGNDAIDFSTSQIKIDKCDIKNIADKGVSGGEGSTLEILNSSISDCNIGAASKDLSVVDMQNVVIANCNYGLVALQKKPEYGPAVFKTRKLTLTNCDRKYLIEKRSVLHFNSRKIEGSWKNVAKLFY